MFTEQIERVGLETFKEILKSLGGWPVLEADKWNESMFTWMESMYKIRESKSFMKISITTDMYNNTNQYLVVSFYTFMQYHYIQHKTKNILLVVMSRFLNYIHNTFEFSHCE